MILFIVLFRLGIGYGEERNRIKTDYHIGRN